MEYRRQLIAGQSARLLCGYLYADAGRGESTTDLVFAGHDLICENGAILAQTELFGSGMIVSEVDLEKLAGERLKNTSFAAVNDEDVYKRQLERCAFDLVCRLAGQGYVYALSLIHI